MGTILEGVWDRVRGVVTVCFKALEPDCTRISMNMKVDHRAAQASAVAACAGAMAVAPCCRSKSVALPLCLELQIGQ